MTYRKFKADYLFTGREMAAPGSVLVTTGDGRIRDILPAGSAGDDLEIVRGILSPGFVNCHCHLELSHMKGLLPERGGLVDFLLAVMSRRNAAVPGGAVGSAGGVGSAMQAPGGPAAASAQPLASSGERLTAGDPVAAAIAQAEEDMLHCGIVAVGDICNTSATIAQKAQGRLYYHNFIETMGFVGGTAADRFAQSRKVFEAFAEAYTYPIEANSIVPHAPYSVSPELFRLIANFPGNQLLSIHNQETSAENDFYRDGQGDFLRLYRAMGLDTSFFTGTGKRSLASYLPYFYPNQSLILVHNVDTLPEDLLLTGAYPHLHLCLCPNANLYISGRLPDVEMLARSGRNIVLGTDSLASNHQLDILEEAKTLQSYFPQLNTTTILQWATAGGAKALQLDSVLGSFTPGKQPGLVSIVGGAGDRLTKDARAVRLL